MGNLTAASGTSNACCKGKQRVMEPSNNSTCWKARDRGSNGPRRTLAFRYFPAPVVAPAPLQRVPSTNYSVTQTISRRWPPHWYAPMYEYHESNTAEFPTVPWPRVRPTRAKEVAVVYHHHSRMYGPIVPPCWP
eukprot:scaffold18819_cov268-Amphora_coffeaeformis.AAC.1